MNYRACDTYSKPKRAPRAPVEAQEPLDGCTRYQGSAPPGRPSNEQIMAAYRDTGSIWKAAKMLGMHGQTVWERLQRLGYKMAGAKWTAEEVEELKRLAPQCTIGEAAKRLGRSYAGVACKISELQLGVRYGNHGKKKVPRGAGLTKKAVVTMMEQLQKWKGSLRQFCIQRGLDLEVTVQAFQRYTPESWQEYVKGRTDLTPKTCPECKNEFYPINSRQLTCSRICGSRRRSNLSYFGGRRSEAVGMEEGVCQLCEKSSKSRLAAHHIIGKDNDPDNDLMIALCNGCHQLVGQLGGRADVLKPEFWENLIALAVIRKVAKKDQLGYHVCVDIDALTEEDIEEEQEMGRLS